MTDRLSASVVVVDWKCVAFLPPMQALLVIVALSEFGMNERVVQRANKMQIAVLRPAPDALPFHMRTWEEGSNAACVDRPKQREGGRGWEENDLSKANLQASGLPTTITMMPAPLCYTFPPLS